MPFGDLPGSQVKAEARVADPLCSRGDSWDEKPNIFQEKQESPVEGL